MIVHIAPDDLEQFARAWLKCALDILNSNAADERAHPDDLKTYQEGYQGSEEGAGLYGAVTLTKYGQKPK